MTLIAFAIALILGLGLRFLYIQQVPGIHFDEAWAANYAAEIADKPGFWPLDAMSPYTHPWSHYITAGFFQILGEHLWVARLAGISMSVTGIVLLVASFWKKEEKRAACFLAFLAATSVPSILNERFAIEINTFHVLCLGLFLYGILSGRRAVVFMTSIFGVTSHILFLAPVLAAFWVWAVEDETKRREDQILVGLISLCLLPFFCSIFLGIPEKAKALCLLAIDVGVFLYAVRPFSFRKTERKLIWVLGPIAAVFLLILLFMSEGDLSIAFTHGMVRELWVSYFIGALLITATMILPWQALKQLRRGDFPSAWAKWVFYSLLLVGLMSTKPAPRYFEMIFLLVLGTTALTLARVPQQKWARLGVGCFVFASMVQWQINYIRPGLNHATVDRSFRYLIFHDNSSDSLPKQNLVAELGSLGCSSEQLSTSDPRLGSALQFLARADWKREAEKKCPSLHLNVERAATGAAGRPFEEFVLQ